MKQQVLKCLHFVLMLQFVFYIIDAIEKRLEGLALASILGYSNKDNHGQEPSYCEQPLSKGQCLLKCVHSMMPIIPINSLLYQMEAGNNEVGREQ
jgi:hypothetical protein